jgi:hypothetical protein
VIDKRTEKKDNSTMSNKTEPIEDKFIIVRFNHNSESVIAPVLYNGVSNRAKVFSSIEEAKKAIEMAASILGIDITWKTNSEDSYNCATSYFDDTEIEIWRI